MAAAPVPPLTDQGGQATRIAMDDLAASPARRIFAMDGLRGLALIGIVAINVIGFGLPDAAYYNPLALGGDAADLLAWAAGFILIDGKMRNLFSLLFGAGLLIAARRADAAGRDGQDAHMRRMGWLALFGLAHHYLLWWGDILFQYALVGTVAWFFVGVSRRALAFWVIALLAAQLLIAGGIAWSIAGVEQAARAPHAGADARAAWHALAPMIGGPDDGQVAAQIVLHRGDYAGIVAAKLLSAPFAPFAQALFSACETLAMMLAGMLALDSGFLQGRWSRRAYARLLLWSYAIGLPAMGLLAWACIAIGFAPVPTLAIVTVAALPFRPVLMIGHAALAILWLTGGTSALRERAAAAGRMALTNYLATSLVMTSLFYGYGLGLYGSVPRAGLWLAVAAMAALMLAWSKPWLARFGIGPCEALWRRLARQK